MLRCFLLQQNHRYLKTLIASVCLCLCTHSIYAQEVPAAAEAPKEAVEKESKPEKKPDATPHVDTKKDDPPAPKTEAKEKSAEPASSKPHIKELKAIEDIENDLKEKDKKKSGFEKTAPEIQTPAAIPNKKPAPREKEVRSFTPPSAPASPVKKAAPAPMASDTDKETKVQTSSTSTKNTSIAATNTASSTNSNTSSNTNANANGGIKNTLTLGVPVHTETEAPSKINLPNAASQVSVSNTPSSAKVADKSGVVSQYGRIINSKYLGDGVTAWVVERDKKRVILYTSPNQELIMAGLAWNAKTKANLTDSLVPMLQNGSVNASGKNLKPDFSPSIATDTKPKIEKLIVPNTTPPDVQKMAQLPGVKEGKGNDVDTLYIVFDYRSSFCQQFYQISREYVKKGYSIKWLPAILMGEDEKAYQVFAYLLQNNQATTLQKILNEKQMHLGVANQDVRQQLKSNKDFFFSANQAHQIKEPGIPTAFFYDKRLGRVRPVLGIAQPNVLKDALAGI